MATNHRLAAALLSATVALLPAVAPAQEATSELCRTTGLVALKQKDKTITDIFLDQDSLQIIQADTKIEDTPVRVIILGDAYLEKERKTGKPYRLICIIGDKGKVLMTYFTLQ